MSRIKIEGGDTLLAGVLGMPSADIRNAIVCRDNYKIKHIVKKSGGRRRLSIPCKSVKKFQKLFLKKFLYCLIERGVLDKNMTGFLPGVSVKDNALVHLNENLQYVVRLDFKNAFPSVSFRVVKEVLLHHVKNEIGTYRAVEIQRLLGKKINYPEPVLFSMRKVKWFRELVSSLSVDNSASYYLDYIVDGFIEMAAYLLTYKGKLPQGAPTSPFMLNLTVSYLKILDRIREFLKQNNIDSQVSIYADDIVISAKERINFGLIRGLIGVVEASRVFRINRAKILRFDINQTAPLITGFRLIRIRSVNRKLTESWLARLPRKIKATVEERLFYNPQSPFINITLPQKQIKKIRGIIHRAIYQPGLASKVNGYVAYLKDIYGEHLPRQIVEPYKKYLLVNQKDPEVV
ncbi:MAG: hypothetical protein HY973_00905 [Candidatus Kerfeldbacteria bacterium]|nr:hypothetical protein [Candidatus Kerfeldbacteria bacterium]